MDTSKEYIAMCDCEEVQGQWKCEMGDWYFCQCKDIPGYPDGYSVSVIFDGDADIRSSDLPKSHTDTWLPRQDQIQEMMGESQNCRYLLKRLNDWCGDHAYGWMLYASMEQLWLAFYMHEKHNKTWDGEAWVNKNLTQGV